MTDDEFERFHAETAGPLHAYLVGVGGTESVAEDLVQTAYIRLLTAAALPESDRARRVYLFRVARNLLADEFRRRKRGPAPTQWREPSGENGTTSGEGLDCESRIEVQRAFEALGERQRELLWLAYVAGLTHREIAEVVGVGAPSVRVLLHRARGRFAERLERRGLGPEDLR